MGTLAHPAELNQLVALLQRLLAVLDSSNMPAGCIALSANGLARLRRFYPERRAELAELPELAELCKRFAALEGTPQQQLQSGGDAWACMRLACGSLGCNPEVSTDGQQLFDVLLAQLPAVAGTLSPFDAADVIQGLAAFYGMPHGGQLAPALEPHRTLLAQLGTRAHSKLEDLIAKHRWRLAPGEEELVREAVAAFAALR